MHLSQEQEELLKKLGQIARMSLGYNDKRVANALCQALDILSAALKEIDSSEFKGLLKQFERISGWDISDLSEELLIACLNTSQFERGLETIDSLISLGLRQERDLLDDKAAFLAALGRQEEAEQMLKGFLADTPDNLWLYIALGDIYFLHIPLDERQNLRKAEAWYYRAYDREIGKKDQEVWEVLLERLGDVTMARLRRRAEARLLELLEKYNIGTCRTLEQLKKSVYITGGEGVILYYLQAEIFSLDTEQTDEHLQVLTDVYNLSPQKALDGLSPLEILEYMPKGEHELRIVDQMFKEFIKKTKRKDPNEQFGALGSQEFTDFQVEFMEQKDPTTGKKRARLIDKEREKIKKDYDEGRLIWQGFIKYRQE
ncbi:hypothetical protein KJ969_01305 [Patescibacteria group bacterium]|nr:hypothetical protein [Patescibacteria group bacterium]